MIKYVALDWRCINCYYTSSFHFWLPWSVSFTSLNPSNMDPNYSDEVYVQGTGEVTQQLRILLAEDPKWALFSTPTLDGSQRPVTEAQGNLESFFWSVWYPDKSFLICIEENSKLKNELFLHCKVSCCLCFSCVCTNVWKSENKLSGVASHLSPWLDRRSFLLLYFIA